MPDSLHDPLDPMETVTATSDTITITYQSGRRVVLTGAEAKPFLTAFDVDQVMEYEGHDLTARGFQPRTPGEHRAARRAA